MGKQHKHFMPAWLAMPSLCCLGETRLGIQSPGMTLCPSSTRMEGSLLSLQIITHSKASPTPASAPFNIIFELMRPQLASRLMPYGVTCEDATIACA